MQIAVKNKNLVVVETERNYCPFLKLQPIVLQYMGRDSSVGIATGYGLDGTGIEPRWGGEIFRTRPDRPWGPLSLLYNGYRVFPGVKAAGAWC
jgi:hypothetical protein